jgi:UDP-N-acetylglucosamine transferase subunit ALG13
VTLIVPERPEAAALDQAAPALLPDRLDLLVVVGTDHHPFDRIMHWVDEWVLLQPTGYRAVVQYGSAVKPVMAEGSALFAHDELHRLMTLADVVVMHGGPASIIEARRLGKVPVVVPRNPDRGEHVDGHQLRFTRRLSELGLVALCETQASFVTTLRNADREPARLRVSETSVGLGAPNKRDGVEAVRRIVDDLIVRGSGNVVLRTCTFGRYGRR